ncbi:SH3 domain-containing protein [Pleurostoma richardsiae]|uniref:SH3 domain-containing protein n=1 Tax=Pleurostoma richardsiae TaxID=41990 RepID=A0AA38RFT4_9PEZI|nr:SH3 domain-containing protein [Pleurostoma richardsiae]
MAQSCISLEGSTTCPAFESSSISTDSTLVGYFPFLQYVSDRASFDSQLQQYVQTSYVQEKYQTLLGCSNIQLTNTSDLYARFTTTVICNSIVQNSIEPCSLSSAASRPVCAETCAQYAESEAYVAADSALCANASSGAAQQIRADFTNCALPANSLSQGNCIEGIDNEPENCGYGNSTVGLCSYCASGGINSTDTCCYNSNAENRCAGVVLPSITPTMTFPTSTATATANSTTTSTTAAAAGGGGGGLSGGAIAGIVVGSVAGVALLALLAFLCLYFMRRVLRPPPTTLRRNGSLSSGSVLAGEDPQSPGSAGGMSSPQGMASQQSEQLPFFKDYYSQDDIHPGDRVAVLWAYQPRAADEFALERGDMLKVVGIWDDGWATGILLDERAEEWEARRQAQRDSGVSNTSGRGRDSSPPVSGEIKAFPLVCVCLPEHWRKTIEGDGSTETGSSAHQGTHGS